MQGKKRFSVFKFTLFVLALIFSAVFVYKNLSVFEKFSWRFSWSYMLLAFVFSLLLTVVNTLSLSLVLRRQEIKIAFSRIYRFFVSSNIYRHIPGGMWNHTGLGVLVAEKTGRSVKTAVKLIFLSLGFQVYAAFFFTIFFLPAPIGILVLAVLLGGLFLVNNIFSALNKLWRIFFKKQKMLLPAFSKKQLLKLLGLNILFWIISGASFAFFIEGLGLRLTPLEFIKVSAAYILAWTAGFLFIPAPSGMGIREFVLGFLLSGMSISLVVGVSTSLLYRLLLLLRDFVLLLAAYFFSACRIGTKAAAPGQRPKTTV